MYEVNNDIPADKQFSQETAKTVGKMIGDAQKIALISHRGPDGDTSGSGLALRIILQELGKDITNVCVDSIPTSFLFLPSVQHFQKDFVPEDFDLLITLDAAAKHQTGFHDTKPEIFSGDVPLINIDHHVSNDMFGVINLVDAKACSTTAVLWKLCEVMKWKVSPDAATCLLNGLMTDTGSFQHSNATSKCLRVGARLLAAGANLREIRKNVFHSTPVSTLRLWGEILERTDIDDDGVVISTVREEDFQKTGADPKDVGGAIDYLNMVPEARYSLLLTEREGKVKGSFRTQRDEVNVSDIAGNFGGGGHVKAAGFTVPGKLQVRRRFSIVPEEKKEGLKEEAVTGS